MRQKYLELEDLLGSQQLPSHFGLGDLDSKDKTKITSDSFKVKFTTM